MALERVTIWTGQSESGPRESIISFEQGSLSAESVIREPVTMSAEHAWYWSPEWQVWEKEADEDWQGGRYEVFESMDDFIASLDIG